MEVGIGHHGEPGIEVCELEDAQHMAQRMVDIVLPDYPFVEGDEVVVLVSQRRFSRDIEKLEQMIKG